MSSSSCTASGWTLALVLLLNFVRVARADAWDAQDARHAEALKAFVCDTEFFTRLSNGAVASVSATPGDLVRYLKRQGITITPDGAGLLLTHVSLKLKGRNPTGISANKLVTAYRQGSTGRHGDFAELDFVRRNPGTASWSNAGSQTTDFTFRGPNGEVTGYGQIKCRSTANKSAHDVVENFVKFQSSDWPGKSSSEFTGLIPRDQFDMLVKSGVLDSEGKMNQQALQQRMAQIDRTVEADGYGPLNRKRLNAGRAALRGSPTGLQRLRFKPLEQTYDEYRKMSDDHDAATARRQQTKTSKSLLRTPARSLPLHASTRKSSAVIGVFTGLLGLRDMQFSRNASRATLGVLDAATGIAAESANLYDGRQKRALNRIAKNLPKALRQRLIPKVGSVRQFARGAGRVAAVVLVACAVWEICDYTSGATSTREFQSNMAGLVGGIASGAAAGAAAGLYGGPIAFITVPFCAIIGGIAGSIICSSAVDSYWATLDAKDLEFAIKLIRERFNSLPPLSGGR
jgi:hypothetical protein